MTDFKIILNNTLTECGISVDDVAADNLCRYYEMLVDWNERMNLTALTSPEDAALKHFADSLTLLKYVDIPMNASVIDVGTGAGFPGMVLKIARPDIRLTLLDSLAKRLTFLEAVGDAVGAESVEYIHSRAEDAARGDLRDSFDFAVSRAVARLNTLCEYCIPYVKVGGLFLAMKGKDAGAELDEAARAITLLSGKVSGDISFELPGAGQREIICIKKISPTPELYPRPGKKIKTKPL